MKKLLLPLLLLSIFYFASEGANAATLELVPKTQDIYQNESFIASVILNTEGESVNAVDLELTFSSEILTVLDISRGGSLVKLWIEDPYFSNTEGTISFIGGMPGGFAGEGIIGNITFLPKNTGNAEISFSNVRVLLNDGVGTEASLVSYGKNFLITEQIGLRPTIRSSSHPSQNIWYSYTELRFQWEVEDYVSYRYTLVQDPNVTPNSPEGSPIGDIRFVDIDEGIFYFILQQKHVILDKEFGPVSRYRVMIDNTAPEMFDLQVTDIDSKQFLTFFTTDVTSGVDYYEVLITQVKGAGVWQIAESPYLLDEAELRGIIKIKAVDKAGNEQIVELRFPTRFTLLDGLYLFLIFIGLLLVSWFWHRRNAQ